MNLETISHFIEKRLEQSRIANSLRLLTIVDSLIDFSSNDYLGFARSKALKTRFEESLKKYPNYTLGSTGSRLLSGNDLFTENLENKIAKFHRAEAALIFNSGYDANLGLLSSLPQRMDTIVADEFIHASMIDGARLSHAKRYTFKHNDLNNLEKKLQSATGKVYILVESIYSMDGDEAPLEALCDLAEQYGAALIVDEAHAVGLFGTQGRGLIEEKKLGHRIFARVITFGKALGTHGAAILGSNALRTYLINFARSFIYSTAASFHTHLSIQVAYEFLMQCDHQSPIHERIQYFKKITCPVVAFMESRSAIQVIMIPGNQQVRYAAKSFQDFGFDVRAILHPTVKAGSERLRICLHKHNSLEDIDAFLLALKKII